MMDDMYLFMHSDNDLDALSAKPFSHGFNRGDVNDVILCPKPLSPSLATAEKDGYNTWTLKESQSLTKQATFALLTIVCS
jgi:hypothetical protein